MQHNLAHLNWSCLSGVDGYQRVRVIVGSVKVGSSLIGKKVISLGKEWRGVVRDHETSAYGLEPGCDYEVRFQYAYLG